MNKGQSSPSLFRQVSQKDRGGISLRQKRWDKGTGCFLFLILDHI